MLRRKLGRARAVVAVKHLGGEHRRGVSMSHPPARAPPHLVQGSADTFRCPVAGDTYQHVLPD